MQLQRLVCTRRFATGGILLQAKLQLHSIILCAYHILCAFVLHASNLHSIILLHAKLLFILLHARSCLCDPCLWLCWNNRCRYCRIQYDRCNCWRCRWIYRSFGSCHSRCLLLLLQKVTRWNNCCCPRKPPSANGGPQHSVSAECEHKHAVPAAGQPCAVRPSTNGRASPLGRILRAVRPTTRNGSGDGCRLGQDLRLRTG
jgi:hypothetical protein